MRSRSSTAHHRSLARYQYVRVFVFVNAIARGTHRRSQSIEHDHVARRGPHLVVDAAEKVLRADGDGVDVRVSNSGRDGTDVSISRRPRSDRARHLDVDHVTSVRVSDETASHVVGRGRRSEDVLPPTGEILVASLDAKETRLVVHGHVHQTPERFVHACGAPECHGLRGLVRRGTRVVAYQMERHDVVDLSRHVEHQERGALVDPSHGTFQVLDDGEGVSHLVSVPEVALVVDVEPNLLRAGDGLQHGVAGVGRASTPLDREIDVVDSDVMYAPVATGSLKRISTVLNVLQLRRFGEHSTFKGSRTGRGRVIQFIFCLSCRASWRASD